MLVDNFLPGGAARRSRGRSSSYSYRWTILNIGKCRRFLINLFSDPPEPPSSPRETDLPGENQFHFLISLTFLGSWRFEGFKVTPLWVIQEELWHGHHVHDHGGHYHPLDNSWKGWQADLKVEEEWWRVGDIKDSTVSAPSSSLSHSHHHCHHTMRTS